MARMQAPHAGTCGVCGKVCYFTRKAAKKALSRDAYRSDKTDMNVYQCGEYFHVGHISKAVKHGLATRAEIYHSEEQEPRMHSPQTNFEVDIRGERFPVESWMVSMRGDLTPVFNGGQTRADYGPMDWVRVIPKVTVAAVLMSPQGLVVGRHGNAWEVAGGRPRLFEDDETALKRVCREVYGLTDVLVREFQGEYSIGDGFRARVYRALTLETPQPYAHDELTYLGDPRKIRVWLPGSMNIIRDFQAEEATRV
jgi:hypothetical protein